MDLVVSVILCNFTTALINRLFIDENNKANKHGTQHKKNLSTFLNMIQREFINFWLLIWSVIREHP